MVVVNLGTLREQERHYGLYKQASPTGDLIVVRRKVGEPVDYMHNSSHKVKRQRENFSMASTHYATLTHLQRKRLKSEIAEVDYVMPYASPHIKVLQGRELFLSRDIHHLNTNQGLLRVPADCCIRLVDENHDPLDGDISLRYFVDGESTQAIKTQVSPTDYCFSLVPPDYQPYIPTGSAVGYTDPGTTKLNFAQLQKYHYHQLALPDNLEAWLEGYTVYGFTIGGRWWDFWTHKTAHPPFVQLAMVFDVWTYDYSGTLHYGTKEYTGPSPPQEWVSERQVPIAPTGDLPKHIVALFSPPPVTPEGEYSMAFQLPGNGYNYWEIRVKYWELPIPYPGET